MPAKQKHSSLEFTAFGGGLDARRSRLVASGFFMFTTTVVRRLEHIFLGKNTRVISIVAFCHVQTDEYKN